MNQEPPTAFPWTHDNMTCTGMTLRDYFAAKAMQGMFASALLPKNVTNEELSIEAYKIADAIRARGETK